MLPASSISRPLAARDVLAFVLTTAVVVRDYAILKTLVLSGSGCVGRAEVAGLQLDDVDWRLGGIAVAARETAASGCRCRPMLRAGAPLV